MGWAESARTQLRDAGYRPGAAASAVLEYLEAETCCRGAQEIHEALASHGRTVGLASVYRVLEALAEQRLVHRVDVGDGIVRFEAADASEHHHHLVCGDCGKVEPFADRSLERAIEAVEERSGYAVAAHDVVLHGSCADCRAP